MSGERLDYGIERQRHQGFIGREAVLAELDWLLVADETDRWVVVTGGPGMGKSAILAAWFARRQAAGAVVPHHFIRRGEGGWDEPAKITGSLAAQIEESYPAERDPDARPESRLMDLLARVSARALAPRGGRLVLLIDGLDEYDAPAGAYNPLAAFLPQALPRVRLLCASRPRHPYLAALEARGGALTRIDLDDPSAASDNDATVRAFWQREAAVLGLDDRFIEEAAASAGGNMQHAVTLRKHQASVPLVQRRVEAIPRGLGSLLTLLWRRVANHTVAVHGLGILCAAREPLSLDELGAVVGWDDIAQREAFKQIAFEFLIETRREGGVAEYRLHHDSIRAHIVEQIGPAIVRGHHAALTRRLATWPAPADGVARRYTLRHALAHRAEAGDWAAVGQLAGDLGFLETKCREFGVHDIEADVARAAERCRASGDEAIGRDLGDLARALARESHWLHDEPGALAAQLWNRLWRMGWSVEDLGRVRLPTWAPEFMRVRHAVSRESRALLRDLTGHFGAVNACVVTTDGRRVVSASDDKTLKVWDLDTGCVITTLKAHADGVNACAVTPDGRRVVSASSDETLKVWDLDTGRLLTTLEGHIGSVNSCSVTPDGRRVVSASSDETLKVWDLDTGRLLTTLEGHTEWVRSCAVTPDGRRVVSASDDKTLRVWDFETGRTVATLEGHTGWVNSCAITSDGQRVVSTSDDKTLKVWDLDTGRILATLKDHISWVNSCAITSDGQRVVSASGDGTLKVWNLDTGRVVATLEGHAGRVNSCAITSDGQRVVSASGDKTLKVWELDTAHVVAALEGHTRWVNSCAVTSDGQRVVTASSDRTLKVWDLDTGRVVATLEGHTGWVMSCAVTPDGRRVVSASGDQTLEVWDLGTGRVVTTLEGHTRAVNSCAVTPNGRRVISVSDDQTLKIWDLSTGRVVATLEGHTGAVNSCAVARDDCRLVTASDDGMLNVWDLDTGRVLATLEGHTRVVNGCAVTPDGRCVVSASDDKTLKVWDLDTGRVVTTLEGHTGAVNSCAVTPDGRRLVSASSDKTLKVWDLATYQCLTTLRGDTSFAAVAATTTTICAGDAAGTLWFLDWPPSLMPSPPGLEPPTAPRPPKMTPGRLDTRRPRAPRDVILFLAANPSSTSELALGKECDVIQRVLRGARHRDFDFQSRWAVSIDAMMDHLNELSPTIIHFSGHGAGKQSEPARSAAVHRDIDLPGKHNGSGIYLQDEQGGPQLVTARALRMMIESAAATARVVVLNACYSEAQADALCSVVDCVIGMTGAIRDEAARAFAVGFYRALGNRRSVGNAVDQAVATLAAKQLPDEHLPRYRTRDGVDAYGLVLGAPA
jgi:WD40 repeat protein